VQAHAALTRALPRRRVESDDVVMERLLLVAA
jgi:hypothetical protein